MQSITFLGVVLDSVNMRVYLTSDRAASIHNACSSLTKDPEPSIRDLAKVIGLIIASFPGVRLGLLHYRALDMDKTRSLKILKGDFEKPTYMSESAIKELHWWVHDVFHAYNEISHENPHVVVTSDDSESASLALFAFFLGTLKLVAV